MIQSFHRFFFFIGLSCISINVYGGDTPCSATVLANDMTAFETYSNIDNSNSPESDPGCGNYVGTDIWFEVQSTANGKLYIATIAGTLANAAMAIYEGPCFNLSLLSCVEDDICGNTDMPITSFDDLVPNATYFIRIWAENGGPNGTFEIRVTEEDLTAPLFELTNNANYISDECIQLTTDLPGQLGCAWYPEQVDFSEVFSQTVTMNFGASDSGADGICMVYQANSTATCGVGGGEIGAGTIPNSLIIEFDTYVNGGVDPPFDHSSVNINGDMNQNNSISAPVSINGGNIETNEYFEITFNWDPSGNIYQVLFEGTLIHNGSFDVINNCFNGSSLAYYGFTASTGGAVNNQFVCPSPPIYPHGVEQIDSVTICDGQSYYAEGAFQTTSGLYTDVYSAGNGCDSIVYTELEVVEAYTTDLPQDIICDGDCIFVGGQQFCQTGEYQVFLESQNGCDSVINVDLLVLDPIAIALPPSDLLTCNVFTVQIDGSFSSNGPGIFYYWEGPNGFTSTDQSPWVTEPGIYILSVVQQEGLLTCVSDPFIVQVLEDTEVPISDAGDDISLVCDGNLNFLDGSGSSEGIDISYSWTGPNGFESNEQNPVVSEAGDYIILVFDSGNGCFSTDIVTVIGDLEIATPTATGGSLNCNNVIIQITGESDLPGVEYEWTGPNGFFSTEQSPMINNPGIYELTLVTAAGCLSSDTALVNIDIEMPSIYANGDTLSCNTPSIQLFGDSDEEVSYFWTGPNGFNSNEQYPDASISGTYTLEVTAENGCTNSIDVEVFSDENVPQVQLENDTLNCTISELPLNLVSSGDSLSFSWQGPNGFSSSDSMPLVDEAGTYILTATAQNGCVVIDSLVLIESTNLPVFGLEVDTISCLSGNVQIQNTYSDSTLQFSWEGPNGFTSNSDNPTVFEPGIYQVIATGINTCQDSSFIEVFNDTVVPELTLAYNDINCTNLNANLIANSPDATVVYTWEGPNGFSSSNNDTITNQAGQYYITITSSNGCIASQSITIEVDTLLPQSMLEADLLNCTVESTAILNMLDSLDYTYEWAGPNGFNSSLNNPIVNEGGIYLVSITGDNSCTTIDSIQILQDSIPPEILVSLVDSINCQSPTGELQVEVLSPNGMIDWEGPNGFSSSITNPSITDPGEYTITVTGLNGCKTIEFIEVTADTSAPVFEVFDLLLDCNNPSLPLNYSSDNSEVSIEWQGPNNFTSSESNPVIDEAGTYSLSLLNADGCETSQSLEVTIDTITPLFSLEGEDIPCTSSNTNIFVLNGEADWTYEWEGPNNFTSANSNITVDEPGTYLLTTANPQNGCMYSSFIEINQIEGPNTIEYSITEADCLFPDFGSIEITTIIGGTEPYQYAVDQNDNFTTAVFFDQLEPGIHTVYIQDINGCEFSEEFELNEFEELYVTLANQITLDIGVEFQIEVETNIDESQIAQIVWTPSENLDCSTCLNPVITGSSNNSYSITITDVNGCVVSATIQIRVEDVEIFIPNIFSPNRDGINDFFTVFASDSQIQQIESLQIFDRWGNQVFFGQNLNPNDPNSSWDGKFNEKEASLGVYTYLAKVVFIDDSYQIFTGDVTLIR